MQATVCVENNTAAWKHLTSFMAEHEDLLLTKWDYETAIFKLSPIIYNMLASPSLRLTAELLSLALKTTVTHGVVQRNLAAQANAKTWKRFVNIY